MSEPVSTHPVAVVSGGQCNVPPGPGCRGALGLPHRCAITQACAVAATFRGAPIWAVARGIIVRPGQRLVDVVEALAAIIHPAAALGADWPDERIV